MRHDRGVTTTGFDFDQLLGLSDGDLSAAADVIAVEQRRRAVEGGDLDALAELGFAQGFDSRGATKAPWMVNGILVCPGIKSDTGRLSHRCTFVSVGGTWVWEHADTVADVIKHVAGRQVEQRSITLVAAYDGLEYDVVSSRSRGGPHEVQKVQSFTIQGGAPVLVNTRDRKPSTHR